MSDTILGYKVASAEEQRRTAIIILASTIAVIVLGGGGYIGFNLFQQSGRLQAVATITDEVVLCQYRVRRFSKRRRYNQITGFINCREARRIMRREDRFGGEVLQLNFHELRYVTADGLGVTSRLKNTGKSSYRLGQRVEILYDPDNPDARVVLFRNTPLGFGKKSVAPEPVVEEAAQSVREIPNSAAAPSTTAGEPRIQREVISKSTARWIAIAVMLFAVGFVLRVLRVLFRLIRRAFGGRPQSAARSAPAGRAKSHAAHGITPDRLAPATGKRTSFGG